MTHIIRQTQKYTKTVKRINIQTKLYNRRGNKSKKLQK